MTTSIQEIIENYILGEIFSEFPTDHYNAKGKWNPFHFFLNADVDETDSVSQSPLGEDWGYEICEAYELEDIRAIRGVMSSMYNDLERLKSSLFQYAVKPVMVSKDEFRIDEEFYNFIQSSNAILYREGTADEYATILTVDAEVVS